MEKINILDALKDNIVCATCGNLTNEIKGTLKCPICADCFRDKFNNNYDSYHIFVNKKLS